MPTAVDASTPFGQTTCGRPPAAPYCSASRSSLSSVMKLQQRRQGPPGGGLSAETSGAIPDPALH